MSKRKKAKPSVPKKLTKLLNAVEDAIVDRAAGLVDSDEEMSVCDGCGVEFACGELREVDGGEFCAICIDNGVHEEAAGE